MNDQSDLMNTVNQQFTKVKENSIFADKPANESFMDKIKNTTNSVRNQAQNSVNSATNSFKSMTSSVKDTFTPKRKTSSLDKAASSIKDTANSVNDNISRKLEATQSAMKSATVNDNDLFEPVVTSTAKYRESAQSLADNLSPPSENRGFFSEMVNSLKSIYFKLFLLVLLLAFLGFNIFRYLADTTDFITHPYVQPIHKFFKDVKDIIEIPLGELRTMTRAGKAGASTSNAAKASGAGTGAAAKASTSTGAAAKSSTSTGVAAKASTPNTNLDAAIAKARPKPKKSESPAHPDEAGSRTQSSKAKGKSSYCYIGEDRGFRSCIKVDDPGTCLSGEIFPTRDICINPTLRE